MPAFLIPAPSALTAAFLLAFWGLVALALMLEGWRRRK